MTSVLDSPRVEAITQAAKCEDWNAAGNLYLELSLQTRGTRDRVRVEALAPCIRRRDAEGLQAVVKALLAADERSCILVGMQVRPIL